MKKKTGFISIFFTVLTILSIFTLPASAANNARYELTKDVNARAYILVSLDTGEVIFEKNSAERLIPASLTKLLTAYTVMKYVDDLDGTMYTAPRSIYDELYGLNSSTADIRQGETLSVRQLLYALLLPSANEAAGILAYNLGNGNTDNFMMMMNNEAEKLGCRDTHFTCPHGLFTDDHYTSAYDMYLIAKACYETEGFMDIVTSPRYELPANTKHATPYFILSTIKIQNKTSPYYRPYVRGMKTGSLDEIGHNFVTMCERNNEKYILVVIGADNTSDKYASFVTTAEIMDYFFENYSMRNANTSTYPVAEIEVKYSKDKDTVLLYADTEVNAILPNDADESSFVKREHLPEYIAAPVKAGDIVGTIDYILAGRLIGTSNLVVHEDIERSFLMMIVGKAQEVLGSLYFRTVICVTLVMVIMYLAFVFIRFKKHEKMQKVRRRR